MPGTGRQKICTGDGNPGPVYMKILNSQKINVIFPALLTIFIAISVPFSCNRREKPSPEIVARYHKDADRFCRAIVDCIKADISRRLADKPERRDMILRRMTRDLCIKGQYRLIGDISVDPLPDRKRPLPGEEVYRMYSECSRAVAEADNCEDRKRIHKTNEACQKLRKDYNSDRTLPDILSE